MNAEVRLAAARARATGTISPDDAATLAGLHGPVWALVVRTTGDGRRAASLRPCPDYPLSADDPHAAWLPDTRLRTLLAVLAATAEPGAEHPWPGHDTTVAAVLDILGGPRIPTGRVRHYRASFDHLAAFDLLELPGHLPGTTPGPATTVRLGPQVAAWDGPWLTELARLVDRVADQAGLR